MEIVYLDQNKWVELARVQAGAVTSGPMAALYAELLDAVARQKVLFPLSASHVLETSKRNDPISRGHVAETQGRLSRGHAYRSRASRLRSEVHATLSRLFGLEPPILPEHWAIAPGFLQAFEPMDELIVPPAELNRVRRINAYGDPAAMYIDFMKNQDDTRRRAAHVKLANESMALVSRMEARRALLTGETVDLRRRAYSVHLFLEHQDLFIQVLKDLGCSLEQLTALGENAVRALVEDVPTLNVEAEVAARLEAQTGSLHPNDVFDTQSFYTAIPYSSRVVAEKSSVSRARQAKLDSRYRVQLSTSLMDLVGVYQQ